MQTMKYVLLALATTTLATACGGGGGGGRNPPPPPPPVSQSFTVTAVAVDLQRGADALVLPVDGLPAAGATLTID